jgi:antitoxin VapB
MATTKVFKSGNSTAVRLPASFGAVPGTVVEVREENGRWVLEPVPDRPKLIDLTGIWGSCPDLKPIASEDRAFDERPSEIEARRRDGR